LKNRVLNVFLVALRIALALLFIYAGMIKAFNVEAFAAQIDNYRLLPYFLSTLVAAILPWLEMLCGSLLLLRFWRKGAALGLAVLNVVFLFAVVSALARGLDITCGCFSLADTGMRIGITKLVENILLTTGAFIVYYHALSAPAKSLDQA
jgi:putative oxidoreductase